MAAEIYREEAAMWALAFVTLHAFAPWLIVPNSVPRFVPPDAHIAEAAAREAARPRIAPAPRACRALLDSYARRDLPSWPKQGKVTAPRIVLARLLRGHEVAATNAYLRAQVPWSVVGSSWMLNRGDYDFSLVPLTALLYLVGERPERLYPETRDHLLDALLVLDGGTPDPWVPRTLDRVFDTENHILMKESSRYLKNQWLRAHGNPDPRYDNRANGLEAWLAAYLGHLRRDGFREFHSVPYEGYALDPLMNLASFAESFVIANLATALIDRAVWEFALTSLDLRQCVSHCRQPQYLDDPRLTLGSLVGPARVWLATREAPLEGPPPQSEHAIMAAVLPYRPPAETVAWLRAKPREYFMRTGHGPNGSACIVSGGPGYLLSAGGCGRSWYEVIPRPTALLLDDGAARLDECLHFPPAGPASRRNHTGVYERFACAPAAPHVPPAWAPIAAAGGWCAYAPGRPHDLVVLAYAGEGLGIVALFPGAARDAGAAQALVQSAAAANPDPETLRRRFVWPAGTTIDYDLDAPPGRWVITAIDGQPADRDYARWQPAPALEATSRLASGARIPRE